MCQPAATTGTRHRGRDTVEPVRGVEGPEGAPAGRCLLSGVLVEGVVTAEALGDLCLSHSTVVPGGAVAVTARPGETTTVRLDSTVSASLTVAGDADLLVRRSVVDGDVAAPDGDADIDAGTILGAITVRRLLAANSLFTGRVAVERRQDGCVRFSYLPPDSRTPR